MLLKAKPYKCRECGEEQPEKFYSHNKGICGSAKGRSSQAINEPITKGGMPKMVEGEVLILGKLNAYGERGIQKP